MTESPSASLPLTSQSDESRTEFWQKRSFTLTLVGLLVGVLIGGASLTVAILSYLLQRHTSTEVKGVRSDVAAVERSILAQHLAVTSPKEGGEVALSEIIRGTTPYPKLHHYIVITPIAVGGDWVMDDEASTYSGSWTGRALFGKAEVGRGQEFLVRILATNAVIAPGPLHKVPLDTVQSPPVLVRRTK